MYFFYFAKTKIAGGITGRADRFMASGCPKAGRGHITLERSACKCHYVFVYFSMLRAAGCRCVKLALAAGTCRRRRCRRRGQAVQRRPCGTHDGRMHSMEHGCSVANRVKSAHIFSIF